MSTESNLAAGRLAGRRAIEARKALRVHSADGWAIYPDSPPGIGWVLAPPAVREDGSINPGGGDRLRYFADREMCLITYRHLTGKDFAP